ncbi:MAG TPA: THUMP domain-containing protein, partial [Desulfobacterales bacterium]|nr:THUMP domain-containing protein [Desulfobacterales bacterium]
QIPEGFETLAEKELESLGAMKLKHGYRGIHFSADKAALYAINYNARLLTRVLTPLAAFTCRDREDLYRAGKSIDWSAFFSIRNTIGIFANVSGNVNIRHSKFASLCLKDAVADFFRDKYGSRPDVDRKSPDIWLNLYIERDRAVINFDTSGGSMHRRGYRREAVEAPMQETLAAAILAFSGWNGELPLHDPMCGSGTLLCEAMMRVCSIPAGFMRKRFGFSFLPDFDEKLWKKIKAQSDEKILHLPKGLISGSDKSRAAVKTATVNCRCLPDGDEITIFEKNMHELPGIENSVIVSNPPYGIRMKDDTELEVFYKNLGDFLKKRCKGSQVYLFFGNRDMIKKIGLKPAWKKPLKNAGLDGRLVKYEMF